MSLFAELQRRKVFKVGAAYLVVGWLLIQVSSTIAPQLNLPEWAPRLITLVILIGFPITLLLAWIFESTPEGIRVDSGSIGNKRIFAVCAILAALAVGWYWKTRPVEVNGGADVRSIAVLPFVNMSDDKGNEYFSDGISEEILNVLARVPELHVTARTSSFSFKGEKKDVPEIARELKVRMILEGSVRKQGDRVRITAQLVDASNGFHLWSETYDRRLDDIFAIQDEIARAIADQLKVKLSAANAGSAAIGTGDLQAYDLYLKGMALWHQRSEKNLRAAEQLLQQALNRDPKFARAWAGLALVRSVLPDWAGVPMAEAYPIASDAAQHALALDPALPEAYAAFGWMAAAESRFATSDAMFERMLLLAPSYASGRHWHANALMAQGKLAAALTELHKAVALDPKSMTMRGDLSTALFGLNRPAEAIAACEGGGEDARNYFACRLIRFDVAVVDKDVAAARAALEPLAAARGSEALRLAQAQLDALEGKGDVQAVAIQVMGVQDATNDSPGPTPLNAFDTLLWLMAIGRNDLAAQRFVRFAEIQPYNARGYAYDPHFDALHCDAKVLELLRSMKVEEPHLAQACPQRR